MLDQPLVVCVCALFIVCFLILLVFGRWEQRRLRCMEGSTKTPATHGRVVGGMLLGWLLGMLLYSLTTIELGNVARDGRSGFSELSFGIASLVGAIFGAVAAIGFDIAVNAVRPRLTIRSLFLLLAAVGALIILVRQLGELFFDVQL